MLYCPNCAADVTADATECMKCGALFTKTGWQPTAKKLPVPPPSSWVRTVVLLVSFLGGSLLLGPYGGLFFLAWVWSFFLVSRVFSATEAWRLAPQALARAAICTAVYGVGIVGGEGFALPGPLLAALIFYNGPKYYPYTALLPAAGWTTFFFVLFVIRGAIRERPDTSNRDPQKP